VRIAGYNVHMSNNLRRLVLVLTAVTLSACASAPPQTPASRPSGTGRVEVTMTGFKSEKGQAMVAFYLDGRGWPDGEDGLFASAVVPISGGSAIATFEDVPAGPFAVSVYHDENGDGKMDTNLVGIPSEDYGFSADASGVFGPPSFEEASLELEAGASMQITVRVH
jgi:uncharacterized protein (DUF2141 family)